jgi:hypothetical protein
MSLYLHVHLFVFSCLSSLCLANISRYSRSFSDVGMERIFMYGKINGCSVMMLRFIAILFKAEVI